MEQVTSPSGGADSTSGAPAAAAPAAAEADVQAADAPAGAPRQDDGGGGGDGSSSAVSELAALPKTLGISLVNSVQLESDIMAKVQAPGHQKARRRRPRSR